jgi:hypothetical protein
VEVAKDILLCQTSFVGPKVLETRDTVTTGSPCFSWDSLKSVEFRITSGFLYLLVKYTAAIDYPRGRHAPKTVQEPYGPS